MLSAVILKWLVKVFLTSVLSEATGSQKCFPTSHHNWRSNILAETSTVTLLKNLLFSREFKLPTISTHEVNY